VEHLAENVATVSAAVADGTIHELNKLGGKAR